MKSAALALGLALALASAASASVLVVNEPVNTGNTNVLDAELARQAIVEVMANRGSTITQVNSTAMTLATAKVGQLTANGQTLTHDVVVHTNFSTLNAAINPSLYNPINLLRTSNWPSVPHVYFFEPYNGCPNINQSPDTTGVAACSGTTVNALGMYTTNGPWTWKDANTTVKAAVATATRPAGIFRCVVGVRAVPSTFKFIVKDADSLGRKNSSDEDSMIVWVRYRSVGDPAPQIFCYPTAAGRANIAAIKIALAIADSASGGKVFDNRARTTLKSALVIISGNGQGDPRSTVVMNGNGVYCPSVDTCDVPYVRAGRDSLRTLGIRYTVGIDPESTTTTRGAQMLAMWKEDPLASFALQPMSGSFASSTTRASAAGLCIDPIGIIRERTTWPSTPTTSWPSCATDTGSIFCGLSNGKAALEALVPGRVSTTLIPSMWDWTPKSWTSNQAGVQQSPGVLWGGTDSLATAVYAAGFRRVLFNPSLQKSDVGMSGSFPGATGAAAAPAGWVPVQARIPVRWGGREISGIGMMGCRWEPSLPWSWSDGHHIGSEFLNGRELGKYYPIDAHAYWNHVFDVQTSVLGLPANSFGGPWGNPWPQFNGYRAIKWLVHQQKAADSFLPKWPDGSPKSLDEWVLVEDLPISRKGS